VRPTAREDRRLLSKCLAGDRGAWEKFVTRFSGLVYISVRDTLSSRGTFFSREDFEDLHNTVFLHLFENNCRKLSQYQGRNGCSPASWLRVVTVRMALNYVRDRSAPYQESFSEEGKKMKKIMTVLFALSLVCVFYAWSYADNSVFFGIYTNKNIAGQCDPETFQTTIGSDWDRRWENNYEYIPASDTSFTFSEIGSDGDKVTYYFVRSENSITLHRITDYDNDPNYERVFHAEAVFSNDYNTATYTGYQTYNFDPGPNRCQGAMTGSLTRVDGFKWTLVATAGTGGTISPSGNVVVNQGADQTFTITANSGYQISDVLVDGVSQGAISTYTFTNVTGDHAISVSFDVAPPATATVTGKITNTDTGKGLSEAAVSFNQGAYVLTTASDGTFSSSEIPAGTYQVEISAANFYAKALSNVTLSAGMTNDLSSALTPKSPEILSTGATPDEVYNDGSTTLLTAAVTHPDGSGSISSVVVDLAQIGGSASQEMYDDGTHGDAVSRDGAYSYQTTVATGTHVQQFSLNVTATDLKGFRAYGNIDLNVIKKIIVNAQPEQVDTNTVTNSLSNQTLVISFTLASSKTSKSGGFQSESGCYVELTVYRPDGTVYGVYNVTESIDISIPKAEAGDWKVKTVNKCTTSVTYEIETKGSGTGMLVGRVTNAYTGLGIVGATVTCNTGGATVTLDDGYFTGVAVAGTDAAVIFTASGYNTNVQVGQAIIAGDVTSLSVQMLPENFPPQPAPSSQKLSVVNDPREDPDPLAQPFAAKELQGNLLLNALFPDYQQPVNIYLGLVLNLPGYTNKLFLFKNNNELVEYTDTLWPWREGGTAAQTAQVLSVPLNLLPSFNCSFYSMVTTDPVSLSNYEIISFTLSINQAAAESGTATMDLFLKKLNLTNGRSGF